MDAGRKRMVVNGIVLRIASPKLALGLKPWQTPPCDADESDVATSTITTP